MKDLLVSVIIPAYNCAEYISVAIDSAIKQAVALEILVIDDCSSDSIDEVMTKYKDDCRVIYIKNEQKLGASGSRNKGVSMARGKYVAFLDADDYWAEGKLKKQLDKLNSSGAVLCTTARELMSPDGKLSGRVISVKEVITYKELLKHNSINCSSVLLLREVAAEFPMCHEDSHEDYIMWLKILKKYGKAVGINEPLLKYRLSSTGKSGSKLKSAKMTFKVYRYMGFSLLSSAGLFCSYAFNGVKKYFFSGE